MKIFFKIDKVEGRQIGKNMPVYTVELLSSREKSAYLKEFLSFKHLSDIMAYQYNSIKAGFLKLRMLHSIRFNH